jgi:crotonobetainyl-CoA:carnitine CoA-transferase CaiB-like acyl-CoA transferase
MMLHGTRVLELEGPFGSSCARILGSLGAELTRVRQLPASRSTTIEDLGGQTSSIELALDLDRPEGIASFKRLALDADVLVESAAPGWLQERGLDHATLAESNPRLIHASITAFGSSGPYALYRGSELVASAMGGVLRSIGYEDRAPVKEALDACTFHAAAAAAAAIMLAHYEREASGRGQHVDVSLQEVAASRTTNSVLAWQFDRRKLARSGTALRYGRASVRCVWELADGFAFHSLMSGKFGAPANAALSQWIDDSGLPNPLREVDWTGYDRSALAPETRAQWEAAIDRFFRSQTKAAIASEGRRRGINATVVQEPSDVLADPQLRARGFFRNVSTAEGPRVEVPDYFVQIDRSEPRVPVSGGTATGANVATEPASPPFSRDADSTAAPLSGVRVLDLSWALVGSLTTKALADHGAVVIKVESATRPCLTRTDVQVAASSRESFDDKPWFAHLNTSKLSLRLNIKHESAREILEPLIDWADIVVENFSPGTLEKLGLDYATLKRRRPDLIMVSGSAYGQTGPLAREWGVDGTGAALSGRTWLTGWPDRPPVIPSAVPYGDVVLPQVMVAAAVAALSERRRCSLGCHIDAAMVEVCAQQMAPALLATQLGGPLTRAGNRDRSMLLQGVYPTLGDDRWIAISIADAEDWARLTTCVGGDWPAADKVRTADPAALDALDLRIAAFSAKHEDRALMRTLQAAGIAAGVVQDAEDLLEHDVQLKARPAFALLEHPLLGNFAHQTCPYHFSRTPARLQPAPSLGQHTETICRDILHLSLAQFETLQRENLFF